MRITRKALCFGALALLIAVGCERTSSSEQAPSLRSLPPASPSEVPASPSGPVIENLAWTQIEAIGPPPRRDHTFTADGSGTRAFVFGGRTRGRPLADLWSLDVAAMSWEKIDASGPSPRFGHNAVVIGEKLVVFGGQGQGSDFFNDAWAFDLTSKRWEKLSTGRRAPAPRYGAGGTTLRGSLFISHGFTSDGRFDDSWMLDGSWVDRSPRNGTRPVKRCLGRIASVGDRILLFGGQTNGRPFLDDTWIYDPPSSKWEELKQDIRPSARNLYALGVRNQRAYLFGGTDSSGPRDDLWVFENNPEGKSQPAWREAPVLGERPSARSGIEAAVAGDRMLVFGGAGKDGEVSDLWQLTGFH